jgi:hypothetical protein
MHTVHIVSYNSDIIGAAAAEEVASALLELGAAVDRDDANDAAWSTPLHNAIASENPALVRLLLQVRKKKIKKIKFFLSTLR